MSNQVISKENIAIAIREYTDQQGQQKKAWRTIGELTTWSDGGKSIELWGAGGLTKASVFPQDNQNNQQQNQQQQPVHQNQQQGFNQQQQGYQGGFQNQLNPNNFNQNQ